MTPDTSLYDDALAHEGMGWTSSNPCVRTGAVPGAGTMALIERLVADFPPFPLLAPLPALPGGHYNDKPCSKPIARMFPSEVCRCGFLMAEHSRAEPIDLESHALSRSMK